MRSRQTNNSTTFARTFFIFFVGWAICQPARFRKGLIIFSCSFYRRDAGFPQSEEAEISDDLIKAYEHGDGELLAKTVRRQNITFLDNEIARLARTLGVPGENVRSNNYGAPPAAGNAYPQQSYPQQSYGDDLM